MYFSPILPISLSILLSVAYPEFIYSAASSDNDLECILLPFSSVFTYSVRFDASTLVTASFSSDTLSYFIAFEVCTVPIPSFLLVTIDKFAPSASNFIYPSFIPTAIFLISSVVIDSKSLNAFTNPFAGILDGISGRCTVGAFFGLMLGPISPLSVFVDTFQDPSWKSGSLVYSSSSL